MLTQEATVSLNPKQQQILQGAMEVFLRSGYAGTSMDRVAAEAGVSKQTIYSHFGDKEGLFSALMEQVTIQRFQDLFSAEERRGDPIVVLRRIAHVYLHNIADEQYIALVRLIIGESNRFPELAKLYGQVVIRQGRQMLCDYFAEHPELGLDDPSAISQIFMGTLVAHVFTQEIFHCKETMPIEEDRVVESLLKLVCSRR
jgi:AcrR family transcriptional regulator